MFKLLSYNGRSLLRLQRVGSVRLLSTATLTPEERSQLTSQREVDTVDVCIVGAGPSGLSAAIRLKQLDQDNKIRVVVLEKGAYVGAHILSGVILETRS